MVKPVKTPRPAPKKAREVATKSLASALASRIDKMEAKHQMWRYSDDKVQRFQTGIHVFDYICGGGLIAGPVQNSGQEFSAKSTVAMTCAASFISNYKPSLFLYEDPEGSLDRNYMKQIAAQFAKGKQEVFRRIIETVIADVSGNASMRYYAASELERVFLFNAAILRMMPNKSYNSEIGSWCYVYPKTNDFKALMADAGHKPDTKYNHESAFFCPTDYTGPEGITVIDSLPALIPEAFDSDDPSEQMAVMARALSKYFPMVTGKLRPKGVIQLCTNQIRTNPAVRFGSPLYEPGGMASKFYSACRNRLAHFQTPPKPFDRWTNSGICVEKSVFSPDAQDKYHFKKIENTKNKTGEPLRQGWCRVWISDHAKKGRGIDPVFDVYYYLLMTGQCIDIEGRGEDSSEYSLELKTPIFTGTVTWHAFKTMILAEVYRTETLIKAAVHVFGQGKLFAFKNMIREQLETGNYPNKLPETNSMFYDVQTGEVIDIDPLTGNVVNVEDIDDGTADFMQSQPVPALSKGPRPASSPTPGSRVMRGRAG